MDSQRQSLLTRQPGKALYTFFFVASTAACFPIWLTYYTLFRPHHGWTLTQSLKVKLVRTFLEWASIVKISTPFVLAPGREKDQFITIEPSTKDVYQAILNTTQVKPATIGGTWFPSPYETTDKQNVICHFHGGAYVIGDGREEDAGYAAKLFIKYADAKVFCPQYRLASNSGGHFPAALQDAVTAYQYLLDKGIPAKKIVISGDSAGGNLALALLRYLSDNEGLLPDPSAALLWSPWLDLEAATIPGKMAHHRNTNKDIVGELFGSWGANALAPAAIPITDPYMTAIHHPFLSKTPMFFHTGAAEILCDEIVQFVKELKNIQDNKVELFEDPMAPHDIIMVGKMIGFEAEAEVGAQMAASFLKKQGINPHSRETLET